MAQWVYPPDYVSPGRQRLLNVLGGIGEGLTKVGEFGLNRSLLREQMAAQMMRTRAEQLQSMFKDMSDKVVAGLDPDKARAAMARLGFETGDYFHTLGPDIPDLTSGVMASIAKSPSLQEMDPTQEALFARLPERLKVRQPTPIGMRGPAPPASLAPELTATGEPAPPPPQPYAHQEELQQILNAYNTKRGNFITATPGAIGPTGEAGVRYTPTQDLTATPGGAFVPTERNPALAGQRTGTENVVRAETERQGGLGTIQGQMDTQKWLAGPEGSKAVAQVKADIQNQIEDLTRQGKITTAAGQAAATTRATQQTMNAPDIVAGAAGREAAMTTARENASAPTEAMSRAAGALTQLYPSHTALSELEKTGTHLAATTLAAFAAAPFGTGPAAANLTMRGDTQAQQYFQAGNFFADLFGYVRSGVAIRPDEMARFMSTILAEAGDTPQMVSQKQLSRLAFLRSAEIQANRGGVDAGRSLADSVRRGAISLEQLNMLKITDGRVLEGLIKGMGGALVNQNGRLVPLPIQ